MKKRFRTQPGRDLYWALRSPMLMDHHRTVEPSWGISETDRHRGLLKQLDGHRSALGRAVRDTESNWIGEYFEVLVRTWIEEVPPARLEAANWQVYAGSNTIGEFDLLFERDRQVWHWELALKFYLGHPAPDGQFRWYGPDPKDRLDRKWSKMRGQQLRLHRHPAARGALDVLGVDPQVVPRAFIKGYLFLPLDERFDVEYPPNINPGGLRGWWVHRSDFGSRRDQIEADRRLQWMILDPRRWMSPAYVGDDDRLCSFEALQDLISPHRPTMVAGLAEGKRGLCEVTRGIVVEDGWPYIEPLDK